MMKLGMSNEQLSAYLKTLTTDHRMRVRVVLMDLNHNVIKEISETFLTGNVQVDSNSTEVTRKLDIDLYDADRSLGLDSNSPDDGILFNDRMLQVLYGVYVNNPIFDSYSTGRWVDAPVFTGPIQSLTRDGSTIKLTAEGKEVLAGLVWKTYSLEKGWTTSYAIRSILRRAGESQFQFEADPSNKIGKKFSMNNETVAWKKARDLATDIGHQLFYDGLGRAKFRAKPTTSVFTFSDGQGGSVLSEPEVSFNPETTVNTVKAQGTKKKSGKYPSYTAYADAQSYMSPSRMGRTNDQGQKVDRNLFVINKASSYTTTTKAKNAAVKSLNSYTGQEIDVKFDSFVIPILEEFDLCTVATERMTTTITMANFTIPLNADGVMNVGYRKPNVKIRGDKIRMTTKRT